MNHSNIPSDSTQSQSASQLSPQHYEHLHAGSGIADAVISERGYRTVQEFNEYRALDPNVMPDSQIRVPAIAYPVYRLGSPNRKIWVLRPDKPRSARTGMSSGALKVEKFVKYEWPAKEALVLDTLPRFADDLQNEGKPIWITEGTKKADAMASHFHDVVPIALNGVWGWISKNEKGSRLVSDCIREIAWNGRKVVLAFDSDVMDNPKVQKALSALAQVLIPKGALIHALYLPSDKGKKLGVDDAIVAGYNFEQIQDFVHPFAGVPKRGGTKLHNNFGLGHTVELPANYEYEDGELRKHGRDDQFYTIYNGHLTVESTGEDMATGTRMLTVTFAGRDKRPQRVVAPQADMARGKGVIEYLGARGATVHEANAKEVAAYLIEFAAHNAATLPHVRTTSRLGYINGGLVLPRGSVGFDSPVQYAGTGISHCGENKDVYINTLRQILTWEDSDALWLTLAASLASPVIARMRPRRNPVIMLGGASGSGKTTVNSFAIGAWADPVSKWFMVQADRTTRAGYYQTLEQLNGLPLLIDDVQQDERGHVESVVYDFANGQSYTRGGVDGKTKGGEMLRGAILLAGEATPNFQNAGANNRLLFVDANVYLPMGANTQSLLGSQRAKLLENAWRDGAGVIGPVVAQHIWDAWDQFAISVRETKARLDVAYPDIAKLGSWSEIIAILLDTLNWSFEALHIEEEPVLALLNRLPGAFISMLTSGREKNNSADMCWDRLRGLLAGCDKTTENDWTMLRFRGELIAAHRKNESVWRVLPGKTLNEALGSDKALAMFGTTWVKAGRVLPDKDGKSTTIKAMPNCVSTRVLCVPMSALSGNTIDEEV